MNVNNEIINRCIGYIKRKVIEHNIDESHGLGHALQVLNYCYKIYDSVIEEFTLNKEYDLIQKLELLKHIIIISALLHDMFDRKYITDSKKLENFLEEDLNTLFSDLISSEHILTIISIINTISYSKVMKEGYVMFHFMETDEYQTIWHIVREADLLDALAEFKRCMIYTINHQTNEICETFKKAEALFNIRMFKYFDNHLLTTNYSKEKAKLLEKEAREDIENWRRILNIN